MGECMLQHWSNFAQKWSKVPNFFREQIHDGARHTHYDQKQVGNTEVNQANFGMVVETLVPPHNENDQGISKEANQKDHRVTDRGQNNCLELNSFIWSYKE
jgi:hypothetical protein